MTSETHAQSARPLIASRCDPLLSVRALRDGMLLTAFATLVLSAWLLVGLEGWQYYTAPLAIRGYDAAHRLLRPSGPVGQSLGVAGMLLMFMPFLYMVRKRLAMLKAAGNLKTWLEVHIFCGIFGPVLITYHTSLKFNGIVSVAYWSMLIVMLSGIIGRYLYVRIPRTIRGHELTQAELDVQARELLDELSWTSSPALMAQIDEFERSIVPSAGARISLMGAVFGGFSVRWRLRALGRHIEESGVAPESLRRTVELIAERASLLRRLACLEQTRRMFELWHVFHLPLVYLMFAIVTLHVALVVYMGYVPFRW